MFHFREIFITCGFAFLLGLYGCEHKSYSDAIDKSEWLSISDGERNGIYYRQGDSIYGGYFVGKPDDNRVYHPLQEVDIDNFIICVGSGYAKDKKHVYYPIEAIYEDGEYDDGTGWGGKYLTSYIVDGADPKSFKYIGEDYAIDKRKMFLRGQEIPWDDKVIERFKKISTIREN